MNTVKLSSHPLFSISVIQLLLIISLLCIRFTDNFIAFYESVLIAVLICTLILFMFGFFIFKRLSLAIKKQEKLTSYIVFIQYFLHIFIIVFIFFNQFYGIDYASMTIFPPLLIAFFISARLTWQACFILLKSKIYKLFITGSTALLIWTAVLTLLGLFYRENFISMNLYNLSLTYFVIHFAELGFVLLKMDCDLNVAQE